MFDNYQRKFTRLFYEMMKEVIENQRSTNYKMLYALDWFLFFYSFRIFYIAYVMYNDFQIYLFDFKYNAFINYFYLNSKVYDALLIVAIFMFHFFSFICKNALYWLNVKTITWQWWHQLVVQNQDDYNEFMLNESQRNRIIKSKEKIILKKIDSYLILHYLMPKQLVKILSTFLAKAEMFLKLENVDKEKLFNKPLSIMPYLSAKLRSRVLIALILFDKFGCFSQIGICKYI